MRVYVRRRSISFLLLSLGLHTHQKGSILYISNATPCYSHNKSPRPACEFVGSCQNLYRQCSARVRRLVAHRRCKARLVVARPGVPLRPVAAGGRGVRQHPRTYLKRRTPAVFSSTSSTTSTQSLFPPPVYLRQNGRDQEGQDSQGLRQSVSRLAQCCRSVARCFWLLCGLLTWHICVVDFMMGGVSAVRSNACIS